MRILRVINDELIEIREFRNANITFNTNEYRKSDDICIYHEQFNPFDLYSDYIKQKQEIERLNNIINEYELYLNTELQKYGGGGYIEEFLDKLKALKEDNK